MSEALYLLLVGMISITVVLSLVVGMGRLLIRIVNRITESAPAVSTAVNPPATPDQTRLAPAKLAAIVAAVEILTEGQGRIQTISTDS
ncbi:MAG: OadG family transporter subunit [Bacteroidota bacterium]